MYHLDLLPTAVSNVENELVFICIQLHVFKNIYPAFAIIFVNVAYSIKYIDIFLV